MIAKFEFKVRVHYSLWVKRTQLWALNMGLDYRSCDYSQWSMAKLLLTFLHYVCVLFLDSRSHLKNPILGYDYHADSIITSFLISTQSPYACVKGHLEPTHLKSSPLFTFSTKSLGQDSPSIHLFSKTIGPRFTTAKIKLGEDSPSWFIYFRSRFTLK